MRRYVKYLASGIIASMILLSFSPTVAADEEWMSIAPGAWNATGYHAYDIDNVKDYWPIDYAYMQYSGHDEWDCEQWIYTNYFTAPMAPDYEYYTVFWPASNATIIAVWVIALVQCSADRNFYLGYSYNHSSTIYEEDGYSEYYHMTSTDWYVAMWDVTSLEAWSPLGMVSNKLWASILSFDMTSTHLNVGYLGYYYNWTQPGGGEGWTPLEVGPGTNYTEEGSYLLPGGFVNITGPLVKGTVGAIGFIGMVAFPAFLVAKGRVSDDKITLGIRGLMAMVIFFSMFIIGIA